MSNRTPRTAIARGSSVVGSVVAASSRMSAAAKALDAGMIDVNRHYVALLEMSNNPVIKAVLLNAEPYHPPHARYEASESYSRWSWFQDYIACKITGGAGLSSFIPPEQLQPRAGEIAQEISGQRDLFGSFKTQLTTARDTHSPENRPLFDQTITRLDLLNQSVGKLRNIALDIQEGRDLPSALGR